MHVCDRHVVERICWTTERAMRQLLYSVPPCYVPSTTVTSVICQSLAHILETTSYRARSILFPQHPHIATTKSATAAINTIHMNTDTANVSTYHKNMNMTKIVLTSLSGVKYSSPCAYSFSKGPKGFLCASLCLAIVNSSCSTMVSS